MWAKPRETVRRVVSDRGRSIGLEVPAVLWGITRALEEASRRSLGETVPLEIVLFGSVLFGAVAGPVLIRLWAAFVLWGGGALGGRASFRGTHAASAWSIAPWVFDLPLIWLPLIAIAGNGPFMSDFSPRTLPVWFLVHSVVVEGLLSVMIVRATLVMTSEVHRFSLWRAFAVAVVPLVLSGILYALVRWPPP